MDPLASINTNESNTGPRRACITFNPPVERNKYEADNFSSVQHCTLFNASDKDQIETIDVVELRGNRHVARATLADPTAFLSLR